MNTKPKYARPLCLATWASYFEPLANAIGLMRHHHWDSKYLKDDRPDLEVYQGLRKYETGTETKWWELEYIYGRDGLQAKIRASKKASKELAELDGTEPEDKRNQMQAQADNAIEAFNNLMQPLRKSVFVTLSPEVTAFGKKSLWLPKSCSSLLRIFIEPAPPAMVPREEDLDGMSDGADEAGNSVKDSKGGNRGNGQGTRTATR
ncbi:hypothetical protein A1O3_07483 [Capronia epimyces CBS 606.96]|uniref:Uncharacterized protein n=1 Tax=Capronia epimyces CBS 606.96 TaxID=1182542 RepID=W9XLU6_9EURO|nr:uncharacterized protein A1O3_07483 [Capronia epimyces CBS 606.96]EXJ81193.1 hypothetical protein A1O3_07483 [Capronia epimyces CBS 606.96]